MSATTRAALDPEPASLLAHAMRDRAEGNIAGRVSPPPTRPGIVIRHHIVDSVRQSSAPIVLVVAPAGYGKTTLLAHLAETEVGPLAWASLDRRDTDPTHLVGHLVEALRKLPSIDPQTLDEIAHRSSSAVATVTSLGSAIAGHPPFMLALDDADIVGGGQSAEIIAALVDQLPRGSRLVLASRAEAPLPTARLRAAGELFEIGTHELALDNEEAVALATGAGSDFDPVAVATLNERAEGWSAGVYLGVLAAQASPDPASVLRRFSGDDRFVAGYLQSELLDDLTPQELRFLRRTAILERMSGPLCDAVLGPDGAGSAATLASLAQTNRFLVPLDRRREWYRLHHFVHDLFHLELSRSEPGQVPVLAGRAAAWFAENDLPDEAIEQAGIAGDVGLMARLLVDHGQAIVNQGRLATVRRWFDSLGSVAPLDRDPRATFLGAWTMILSGDARAAGAWQTAALAMNNEVRRHSGDEALEGLRALLSATIAENGLGPMLAAAELATELIPQRDPWRPLALTVLGVTRFISGDQLRADRALLRAVEAAAKTEVTAKVIALAYRAVLACDRGEWSAAETHAHDARVLVIQHDMTDYAPMILIDALSARVATRRGNRSQAIADVKHAQAIRPELSNTIPWLAVQARLELARASLALGDAPNALHLLEEADRMLDRVPALGRLNADADEIRGHAEQSLLADSRVSALTTAELRLLPYLATHLSFPRLGERLGLSESTVKTHAISIYRKLDASSRDEAVEAAVHVGLLDPIGPSVGFRRTA